MKKKIKKYKSRIVKSLKKTPVGLFFLRSLPTTMQAVLLILFVFATGFLAGSLVKQHELFSSTINPLKDLSVDSDKELIEKSKTMESLETKIETLQSTISELENKPTPTPEVVYREVEKKVQLAGEEYEAWCRENTVGLIEKKNSQGKLLCFPPNIRLDLDDPLTIY